MENVRPVRLAALRALFSTLVGWLGTPTTNRWTKTPSMPYSSIQSKCRSTVCRSSELNRYACEPSGLVKPGAGYLLVYSLTSGHISKVRVLDAIVLEERLQIGRATVC